MNCTLLKPLACKRYLLFLILLLGQKTSYTQYFSGTKVIDSIGESKFYFVGQLHCNQANSFVEKELLFALNNKYGVQNYILEYGHSLAFIINKYLKTGQDSFLVYISSTANFNLIRVIKAHNDSVSDNKRIKFFGLDFENRNDGRFTRYAIQLIATEAMLPERNLLSQLLEVVVNSKPKEMEKKLDNLRIYLFKNPEECRSLLKDCFIDLFLIVNAQYNFSPKRDDAMVENFKRLYNELQLTNSQPSFFASFGTGHINPTNRNGIAMRLLKDKLSPVAGAVNIIGVQYFNATFYKDSISKPSDGSLSFLCKNAKLALQSFVDFQRTPTISFISKKTLTELNCDKALNTFSGLLVIQNFDNAILCEWQ